MAHATSAREPKRRDGEIISYKMDAVRIPKGVLVCINQDGYATNGGDKAGYTFAGVSYETVDNSEGLPGDASIRVLATGTFVFDVEKGDCLQCDVGEQFGIVDNHTVVKFGRKKAGTAVECISPEQVRIRIDRFAS